VRALQVRDRPLCLATKMKVVVVSRGPASAAKPKVAAAGRTRAARATGRCGAHARRTHAHFAQGGEILSACLRRRMRSCAAPERVACRELSHAAARRVRHTPRSSAARAAAAGTAGAGEGGVILRSISESATRSSGLLRPSNMPPRWADGEVAVLVIQATPLVDYAARLHRTLPTATAGAPPRLLPCGPSRPRLLPCGQPSVWRSFTV